MRQGAVAVYSRDRFFDVHHGQNLPCGGNCCKQSGKAAVTLLSSEGVIVEAGV